MWLPQLLLVAWLPGALLFRAPVATRARRAQLDAEERAFWAVVISVAWSSMVGLGLAAAAHYTFGRLLAIDGVACASVIAIWRGRLLYRGSARRPSRSAWLPIALLVLGGAEFFPVAEYVIGGKDPGIYINEGIALAQRGSFVLDDRLVAAVPAFARDIFFPWFQMPDYYSLRFMGFFVLDPAQGTVIGQFPHFYPVWVAIGFGLYGITGALGMIGGWALVGLLAVYFVGVRLYGRLPAFAAAVLLAVSLVEVWFARYPNSEVVQQALLFAGLLAFARSHVDEDRFFAPVSGVVLGLLICLRFDAVLGWVGVGAAVGLLLVRRVRPQVAFVAPFAATAGTGFLYLATWMRAWLDRPKIFLQNLQPLHLALIGAVVVCAVGLLILARYRRVARLVTEWLPHLISVAVIVAAAYAYFFRVPAGRLASHDADSLRTFVWYFPRAGLIAAIAGFGLLAWKRFWRDPALLLVTAVYGFFVFYKLQIVPEHFWMTRRFVPVILPAAFLLLSGAVFFAWWAREPRRADPRQDGVAPPDGAARRHGLDRPGEGRETGSFAGAMRLILPIVFVVSVGVLLVRASAPILRHVEYKGLAHRVERLAQRFTDRDLVVFEARRSSDLHVIALPLAYIYGRNVLVLQTPRPDREQFRRFLAWARSRFRNVYFAGSGGTDLLSRSIAVTPVVSERFQVPEYQAVRNAYPTGVRQKEFDFSIYRFVDPPAVAAPFALDVGAFDDLYVVRFNAKELLEGRPYRWTNDASYVSIVGITEASAVLTLWLGDGGRPASAVPATVSCFLDDRPIGTVTVRGGFQPYRFPVPPDVATAASRRNDPALLRIVSATWSPKAALGVNDDRQLGVMLTRVEVQ